MAVFRQDRVAGIKRVAARWAEDLIKGMNLRVGLLTALATIAMLAAIALCGPAAAQDYPSRPITLVVPVPPGGASDFIARTVGAKLADALGQSVVIANRSGGGGTIATGSVAKADADGHTLLLASITTHGIGPHLYATLPYDPVRDFAPVIFLANFPLIMTVSAALPARSVAEVVALAKSSPGGLGYASSGNGGAPHLAGELFKRVTGANLLHVPYRGSGPAVIDVVAGRVAIMFDGLPSLLPFILAGKVRPLAAASLKRNSLLPDLPTFAELGYDGMDVTLWYGLVAPAATPKPIVDRLNAELTKILAMPDLRKNFADQGAEPGGGTPEAFGDFMRTESARWRIVVKEAGIKAE
jgi:tripartite-type tricarboxylate transporter receptor subunit TctC